MVRMGFLALLVGTLVTATPGAELNTLLETLNAVSPQSNPSATASAWRELAKADAAALPRILHALDSQKPLAANWLRSAVDAIAERQLANGGLLPVAELEAMLKSQKGDPRARRLAFELLRRANAESANRLIPDFLHDSSVELRREAVEQLIQSAQAAEKDDKKDEALNYYKKALDAGRDEDQVKALAASLKKLGHKVNLPRHFGFITHWQLIGPFDNTDKKGFAVTFDPEKEISLQEKYQGKKDVVKWLPYATQDDFGMVDLNKGIAKHMGATGYAFAEFESEKAQSVQIRLGCKNAWKVWLNGQLLFARDEYHRGMKMDQYQMPANMKQGINQILVKVCQNEQTDSWAQEWQFQLRVCDAVGTAVHPVTRADNASKPN